MSHIQRLFSLFVAIVAMVVFPASAWADDQNPREGIDYVAVRGPNPGSSYYRLRDGANVYSPKLFQNLGTDMESFREDNRSITIPLCRTAKGGYYSPNEAKHESDAAWQGCSADRRYLYVLPGTRFEVSGMKMVSFDQRLTASSKLIRCRGKADCINEQLVELGLAPNYGKGESAAANTTGCADTDQACLLGKLQATGWKPPEPGEAKVIEKPVEKVVEIPKIIEVPMKGLTFDQRYGAHLAIGMAGFSLLVLGLLFHQNRGLKKGLATERETALSDYKALNDEKTAADTRASNAASDLKRLIDFIHTGLAKDLGLRLEPKDDAKWRKPLVIIQALEVNATLRLTELRTILENLGVSFSILNGKSFAEMMEALVGRSKAVKEELLQASRDLDLARRQSTDVERRASEEASQAAEAYANSLNELKQGHAAEMASLEEFRAVRDDATALKLSYVAYDAVKRGLAAVREELKQLEAAEAGFPADELGELETASANAADPHGKTEVASLAHHAIPPRLFDLRRAKRGLEATRADIQTRQGDLQSELERAAIHYQTCLQKMEMHLAVPLSTATAEAQGNEALLTSQAALAEAMGLREFLQSQEVQLRQRLQALEEAESSLFERERDAEQAVEKAINETTRLVEARTESTIEQLNARIEELEGQSIRTPSIIPGEYRNGGTNGSGNGHEPSPPKTRTQPFGLGSEQVSAFDLLQADLELFGRNAAASSGGRPRLEAVHLRSLLAFLGTPYELGRTIFTRLEQMRERSAKLREDLDPMGAIYKRLVDGKIADLYGIAQIIPFLGDANGLNGHTASAE